MHIAHKVICPVSMFVLYCLRRQRARGRGEEKGREGSLKDKGRLWRAPGLYRKGGGMEGKGNVRPDGQGRRNRANNRNKRLVGNRYERLAADYLEKQGMRILESNYRNQSGEIDIIGMDGGYLVFVEVKYRKDQKKGEPAEAVTVYKQRRIRRVAEHYLYSRPYGGEIPCRCDVVSVLGAEISWIKDAF